MTAVALNTIGAKAADVRPRNPKPPCSSGCVGTNLKLLLDNLNAKNVQSSHVPSLRPLSEILPVCTRKPRCRGRRMDDQQQMSMIKPIRRPRFHRSHAPAPPRTSRYNGCVEDYSSKNGDVALEFDDSVPLSISAATVSWNGQK